MVSKQAHQRKALKLTKLNYQWLGWTIFAILAGALAAIGWLILHPMPKTVETEVVEIAEPEPSASEITDQTEVETPQVAKIDLQPTVDAWIASVGGNKSVLIYDLDRDEVAGEYNADMNYDTASIYKLFVVYEGYRRVQNGEWQLDAPAGSTGYTIGKCLDLAIRESYSPCAETLWGMIGRSELDAIITEDFGVKNSQISSLVSNPRDIVAMLKIYYNHREITDDGLMAQIKDSFLNQPTTTYNWRQGLPSGFTRANVYNKVGWDFNPDGRYWNIYHDAAIVEFPELNRHFIVVVMTNYVPFENIRTLGTMIEEIVTTTTDATNTPEEAIVATEQS